jgi:U32 family peptidase
MKRDIELLAPGGDIDSIKAAIVAGADAVYCGLDKFNARNRAENIGFENLNGIIRLAHQHHCQIFLTLNIIIVESEIPALFSVLNKLANTGIDGIIVQDLGLLYLLSHHFKGLKIHASTQLTTHNEGQIHFLNRLSATRVNLSRELNLNEIKELAEVGHNVNMLTEVFVHGSNCLCFSGICYISSVHSGNSGNRGRCSQPCRDQYETTPAGMNFPLNLKDNSAFSDLRELAEAGVDSIKIEGRIKKFHYVYTIVDAWRKHLNDFYTQDIVNQDNSALYKVFNRGFSNAFLSGNIYKEMFIDNPRDNSAIHLSEIYGDRSDENLDKAKGVVYDERTDIITAVEQKIHQLSIAKAPVAITISGECGSTMIVSVKTPEHSFEVLSEVPLKDVGAEPLTHELLMSRLKAINETEFFIEHLRLEKLRPNLYLPFKELTSIKKKILFQLNGGKEVVDPVEIPVLKRDSKHPDKPLLMVLISDKNEIPSYENSTVSLYFQLPNCFSHELDELVSLFSNNHQLIPWFPSVLIGEDYRAAVAFLDQVKPSSLVTNNTGIAFEAWKRGISWIAGPYLNIVNSFSLLCLKEMFNCSGAFISDELNKTQIKGIKKPENFDLYYSIYHPIVLMTSRQCLFHQVIGCDKDKIDDRCIQQCHQTTSIRNLKQETFLIEKSRGNYHCIYHDSDFMNTDIVGDMPELFSGFMVDFRGIQTETRIEKEKSDVINLFEELLSGKSESATELHKIIHSTTNRQYKKGI